MQRNGKTQHGAGDTLTLLGTPSEMVGTPVATLGMAPEGVGTPSEALGVASKGVGAPSEALGTPSESQGTASESQKMASELPGASSRRRVAAFTANAGIARRLAAAQLAIDTVLGDHDLQIALAAYGYDAARMAAGAALRDRALALQQQQHARYGDQYGATDAHASAQAQAHLRYKQHRGVARVALRGDRGAAQTLGLHAPQHTTQAGRLLQAQQFYANALADTVILGALAGYNLTQAHLAAGQAQVAAVATGAVARQTTQSVAQETTRVRDAALQALNRWMRDFLAIARIALADQPQRLAQLGVTGG
jgi:hypothetical protein